MLEVTVIYVIAPVNAFECCASAVERRDDSTVI
jgi:hypothetical protein